MTKTDALLIQNNNILMKIYDELKQINTALGKDIKQKIHESRTNERHIRQQMLVENMKKRGMV